MADRYAAEAAERDGDWDRAIGIYRELLSGVDSHAEQLQLHIRIGSCLFEDSKLDAAEDVLANAASLAESNRDSEALGKTRLIQGLIELEQGHHRRALERLTMANSLLGDAPRVLIALANAMRERGELNNALRILSDLQSAELSPHENADLLDELGAVHLERGDFQSAEETLRQALELDDRISSNYQSARSRLLLAQAVMGRGRRREARRLIEEATEGYEDSDRGLSEVFSCLGQWYEDGGDLVSAARQYRRARDADQESEDVVGQARANRKLARIHRLRGDKDRAQDALEEAGRLLMGLDDDLELAALYMEEGHLLIADVDYDQAIERFKRALAVAKDDQEDRAIAIAKRGLAQAYWEDGQLERAETLLREAQPVLEERGDLRELNELYDDLGEVLIDSDRYDDALVELERSLELDELLQTVSSKARTLLLMGQAHLRRGDRRVAGERLQQALDAYRESEDDEGKANALCHLGSWFAEEGRLDEALDKFKDALRIDSRQEDSVGIARAQRGIAGVYRRRGELERASESLAGAEAELKHKDDPMEEALLSLELARLAIDSADWRDAESHIKAAIRGFDETRSPVQRAIANRLMAAVYAADPKSRMKALDLLLQAESVFVAMHDYPDLDDLYDDLALLYLALRRPDDAMRAAQESLAIGSKMGWEHGNGRSYLIMAQINMQMLNMKEARRALADAIESFERASDDVGRSEAHLLLGDWYVANDDLDDAVSTYKEARRIDRWHGDLRGMARALRKLGEVYLKQGDPSRAEESFDQASDYMKGLNFVDDRGHLALARGCLHASRGDHDRAITEFRNALSDFDTLLMEEERVHAYKELAASHHALGQFSLAMECMRKMGLEQAALWGSLLDNFHSDIRTACQPGYLRGDFPNAVTGAFATVETALRQRAQDLPGVGPRPTASELIDAWYRADARGTGSLDEKNLAQLKHLATAGFSLFRNPVLHDNMMPNGIDAFVALSVAQYIYTHLDA